MGSHRLVPVLLLGSIFACGGGGGGGNPSAPPDDEPSEPGVIEVTVQTSGADPDGNGYTITLDGQTVATVEINGTVRIDEIAPGTYTLTLSDEAPNCTIAGDASRSVIVRSGQTSPLSFALECPPMSVLQVTVSTTGDELDADGYTLVVDGQEVDATQLEASITLEGLSSGSRQVALTGIADNCNTPLVPEGSTDISLPPGGVAQVTFEVLCLAPNAGVLFFVIGLQITTMSPIGGPVTFLGAGTEPAVSPDGRRVAFNRGEDILVMNVDGSDVRNITNSETRLETRPAWSPDGTRIAFMGREGEEGPFDVFLIDPDGTDEVKITNSPEFSALDPSFSPDGERIAVRSFAGGSEGNLWLMDPDGSNRVELTLDGLQDGVPEWSPDGQRIAFGRQVGGSNDNEVFVINVDGTGLAQLTNSAGRPSLHPSWSPDGRWIVFGSRPASQLGRLQLFLMRADGSDVVQITGVGFLPGGDMPFWTVSP